MATLVTPTASAAPIPTIRSQLAEDLNKRMIAFTREFSDLQAVTRRTIPELLFRRDFLPLFAGKPLTGEYDAQTLLSFWNRIASSPFSRVDVVGDAGKVIATVPPILDTNVSFPNASKAISLAHVFEVAVQKATISPMLAENTVNEAIHERFYTMVQSKESLDALSAEWVALLALFDEGPAAPNALGKAKKDDHPELDL